ncbi:hypothetical protein D3C73_1110790 [compost metagenome]
MAKAQLVEFGAQACFQLRPVAEQPQAGLDFKHHRARVMHADLGTETIGPGRQELLPVLDVCGVVFSGGEALAQRLGGGHRLTRAQAQCARLSVDRLQHPALRRAGQQRQRFIGVGALTQYRVQRQLRE